MISQEVKICQRKQVIIPVDDLQISEVGCSSESFSSKMATAHLCRRVETWWSRVHYLSSKLYHACMASQMTEQKCRPISN